MESITSRELEANIPEKRPGQHRSTPFRRRRRSSEPIDGLEKLSIKQPEGGSILQILRKGAYSILQGFHFQCLTVSCTFLNAIVIGLETDVTSFPFWDQVELAFLVVFTSEVVLRLFVQGFSGYLCGCEKQRGAGDDVMWNIFDFLIVSLGWLMRAIDTDAAWLARGHSNDATLLRAVRLLRLLRLLRLIRVVRYLKQLYLLAYGFLEGFSAVFWIGVLAASLMYLCAIVLVRTFHGQTKDDPDYDFFNLRFATIPGAMLTLFETMASPNLGTYRHVFQDRPLLAAFMILFVIFGALGMNGLLTGVITESMMEKNQARIESQRQEREFRRKQLLRACSELFDEAVEPNSQYLTLERFLSRREDIHKMILATGGDVTSVDIEGMFLAVDYNHSGCLDKVDFVNGVLELCEDVRPVSLLEVHRGLVGCQGDLETFQSLLEELATRQEAEEPAADIAPVQEAKPPVAQCYQGRGLLDQPSLDDRPPEDCPGASELKALGALQLHLASEAQPAEACSPGAELAATRLAMLGSELARLVQENVELLCFSDEEEEVAKGFEPRLEQGSVSGRLAEETGGTSCCLGAAGTLLGGPGGPILKGIFCI